ncbi:MAG: polysaccharide biosynthesis tyrosine autokinase [Candidatus Methylacidiphilales bacterium]
MASWSATLFTRLHRYKNLLKRRWWVLLLTISMAISYQAFKLVTSAPVYVSSARMMVDPQIRIPEKTVYSEELTNFFGTQIELMRSGKVLDRATERVRALHPEITAAPVNIQVFQQPQSNIFNFVASGADPDYTRKFLDAAMDSFVFFKDEMRSSTSQKTLSAITEQVLKLERELKASQHKLFEFQKSNDVTGLQEQGNTAAAYVAQLEKEHAEANKELQLLELMNLDQNLQHQETQKTSTDETVNTSSATELLGSQPEFEYLKAKRGILILEKELQSLLENLSPNHPKVLRVKEEIAKQTELLGFYRTQSLDQIETRKESLSLQIRNIDSQMKTWQAKALDSSRLMAEYASLQADVERIKNLYDRLLDTTQNLDVSTNVSQATISILESASPANSTKPGTGKALGMGLLFGLLIGGGILFLLDRIDDRVNSFTELRDYFEEEVLGQVPLEPLDGRERVLLVHENDERQVYAESFRNIRSSLMYMAVEGERPRSLIITSAVPGEGKSTVSANLAITMAFAGSRTLLVDADLRKGLLNEDFGVSSSPGLAEMLEQKMHWTETLQETGYPNLHFIARGHARSHIGELLIGPTAELFLKEIRDNYDFMIFDTPPILAADDTPSLAPKIDGTLMVMRSAHTSSRMTQNSLDLLYQRQVNVLGLVFNCIDTQLPDYYHYQYYKSYYTKTIPKDA